jgi:hypothetical protein
MKKRFRGFYLLISSLFIYLLHLPFVFARSANGSRLFIVHGDSATKTIANTINPALSAFDSLQSQLTGLSRQAFEFAKKGLDKIKEDGRLLNDSIISIVDFSQPSNNKRLYILDLRHYKVLFNTWVSHGRNSGLEWAQSLSNKISSYKSSPGFYITGETYIGNNGYSLRLTGIEKGINDNAYSRAIVMHGAPYVNPSYIIAQGYIGRSEGCPAIPLNLSRPIINTIKGGSCLFIYHPAYIKHSALLN